MEKEIDHKKRIRFLRRLIIISVLAAILIPVMLCVILAARYDRAMNALDKSREELTWYKNHYDAREVWEAAIVAAADQAARDAVVARSGSAVNEAASEAPPVRDIEVQEEKTSDQDQVRRVYLTFDDGPSPMTGQILDILSEYGVKATFFVVGRADKRYADDYRRIVEEGHTLAMHSYSHRYADIYRSTESFQEDLHKLQNFLYDTTGEWCKLYRFPGGSSNNASAVDMDELMDYLDRENITWFDWNVDAGDASGSISAYEITDRVIEGVKKHDNAVVLMHDAAEKGSTVEALPTVIETLLSMDNTMLLPITGDTEPVRHK